MIVRCTTNAVAVAGKAFLVGAMMFTATTAQAQTTLKFDDLPAFSQVGSQYSSFGVTFTPGDFGVMVGLANGDPGNWGVDGTNGPYFLGFNGGPSYSITALFSSAVSNLFLDVSRTNGSQAGDTFTIAAFNGTTLLTSQTITFNPINSWTTVNLAASGITSVAWSGSGQGFHPYGVDNIKFDVVTATPEPASMILVATGLVGVFGAARRRRGAVATI